MQIQLRECFALVTKSASLTPSRANDRIRSASPQMWPSRLFIVHDELGRFRQTSGVVSHVAIGLDDVGVASHKRCCERQRLRSGPIRAAAVMPRRTLPVGLVPQPGEVLESWLGTFAMRQNATFGDFLLDVSSSTDGVDLRHAGLSVYLTEQELAAISVSTGQEPELVHAMTLASFDGHLASFDTSAGRLRWSPWDRSRTRFCPTCLNASGGRWQLRWRLPWEFLCDTHGCLLEDNCPGCGQAPRVYPYWLPMALVPDLLRCRSWIGSGSMRTRCGSELFTTAGAELRLHDPLAAAHSQLSTVLANATTTFGIYSVSPATSLQVLADVRMLSARLLAVIPLGDVDDFLGANRWCSIRTRVIASSTHLARWRRAAEFTARAPALITC